MSNGPVDDADAEYPDAYDDAELYDDGEAYDDSESAASRARRRRARALAARRRAAARRVRALPATAPPRAVVSAVKELDLQAQMQQDTLRGVVAEQSRKLERANLAAVATALLPEVFRTFGTPDNTFVRVGIEALPLVLLPRGSSRGGIEGVIRHPAVYGGLGLLGLGLIGDQRKRGSAVQTVNILGPTLLTVGKEDLFVADVIDGNGKPSDVKPTWQSANTAVAEINATTGAVRARAPGVTIITATAGGVERRSRLEVVPPPLNEQPKPARQ